MNGNAIEGVNGQAFYDHNTNDYYHTWTFVDFCNDRLLDQGARTNADYLGFIFVQ